MENQSNYPTSVPDYDYQSLLIVLNNLLSPSNDLRNNAEKELKIKKLSSVTFFIDQLLSILQAQTISLEIKKLCAIIIRNTLFDNPSDWLALSFTEHTKIKVILHKMIVSTEDIEVMKLSASIFASMAYTELLQQNQTIVKTLIDNISSQSNNDIVTSAYLYSLKLFFEQYKQVQSIDFGLIQPIVVQISKNLISSNSIDILVVTLELEILILPFLKNYLNNNKDSIILPILQIINSNQNIQILVKAILTLYEIITLYHIEMVNLAEQIFQTINKIILLSKVKEITLYSINILCLICDKETLAQTNMTQYILTISKDLANMLITTIDSNTKLVIDDDDWSISRASCYFLSYLVQIQTNSSLVEILLVYVSNNFNDSSSLKRFDSLLVLSCCLESNHKETLSNILLPNMVSIWMKLNDKNDILSIALSWVIGKISELLPNVFERKTFHELIPALVNTIINDTNNIITRINTAITFGNIIRYYGDEKTSHYKNSFSTYYKIFVDKFIDTACNLNSMSIGLSFYLIRIIMNVVQYSSIEYQDYLEILLTRLLSHFEVTTSSINKDNSKNKLYYIDLQINLCLIIHQIFCKIIRRVNRNLCKRLYNAIMESFKQREPFESGILCLFNIVIIIEDNIDQFFVYLYQCFNNKDNYLLLQGAVATISNLAWNKNNTLKQCSQKVMISLFSILTDENIKSHVKPLAISAIGDICFNFPSVVIEHIQSIITLLFSTFEVVISIKDKDSLIILKHSIECFSMILFAIQEEQKEQIIFMYIKQLIGYINYFSSIESKEIKNDLVLLFGDLVNLLGERIREFSNKEEVKLIKGKLEDKADENRLKWMTSIIDKIFY